MTQDDEVRAMEIATKLVTDWLGWATVGGLNDIGSAIAELTKQVDNVEEIRAVGELLEALTERDRGAIARGERWSKRSRLLSQDEARTVLRGLTLDQLDAFAERWGYCLHEVFEWSLGQREIHGGALWALGQQDEMAKITGEQR